jgi:putative spermidine/putrescine transport system permease protein
MNKTEYGGAFGFIVPLLVLMTLVFNLPLIAMLARSVSFPAVTAEHYQELFGTQLYLKVVLNTFQMAAIGTSACVLIGYPLAYWMYGLPPRSQFIALALVVIPFWISVLIRTYAWIIILGNAGIVNQGLLAAGLVGSPVAFLYNKLGVAIGMVNLLLPFLVLPLFVAMLKIDTRLLHAARSLGASDNAVFWRVFFPLTLPALAAGSLLVFIMSLGFYVTPMILGGGRVPMLVNMLDLLINRMPNWPLASAISAILLVITLALYALGRRIGGQSLF